MGKFKANGSRNSGSGASLSSRFAAIASKPSVSKKTQGKGKGGRGPAGKGKQGPGPQRGAAGKKAGQGDKREAKKPATKDDLDMDMDKYWYQAGKGPNPEVAALDKDLDEYLTKKNPEPAAAPSEAVVA